MPNENHSPVPGSVSDLRGSRVAMLGAGGSGMSALARLLASMGVQVRGFDTTASPVTDRLAAEGISITIGHGHEAAREADVLVATAAIPKDHPALAQAVALGLPVLTYPQALGLAMRGQTGLAIAGTHGKSTTVAMLGAALVDAGLDPTVIAGAASPQLARGALAEPGPWVGSRLGAQAIPSGPRHGRPGLLVAEACEFNRSFHNLHPTIAGINNVEADHLDIYGSLDAVVEAFAQFARALPPASEGGVLVIGHDGAHRREVAAGLDAEVQTIGYSPQADWVIEYDERTLGVSVRHREGVTGRWSLRLPGAHNAANSAMAFALACTAGADPTIVARSLAAFSGLERRCQVLGDKPVEGGAVRVYDDYGHHPTEVDATLRAIRAAERPETRGGRLIVVFQPHQHSRTRFLLDEFATAFGSADMVIVPEIYFVRDSEAEKQRVSAADLVQRLRDRGVDASHAHPFGAIVEQLERDCKAGDVLVVMGAGPVWQVARGFMDAKRAVAHA
ncbi:MAG: UDP-N-acetylmuramate--L-alanine ligase [Phycisphaerales bacterium JB064]